MKNYAGIKVTAVSTGASKVNLQSIQDGDFQLGFTQSDVMTYAWEGSRSFEADGGTRDFRVLGSLYPETVQLMTMDDSIRSVDDLRGKRVSIGAGGSGVFFNASDVLDAAGISMDDIKPQYQSFEDSKEALKDGKIDAAFIVAAAPTTAITELATTNGMHLINIDGKLILANKDFDQPNGLCVELGEETMLVNDTVRNNIRRYKIEDDCTLSGGELVCETPTPDGTKIDKDGNIYTTFDTGSGVRIFTKEGKHLGDITVPGNCRNFCFGGDNLDYLFFACDTIYRLKIKTQGYNVYE